MVNLKQGASAITQQIPHPSPIFLLPPTHPPNLPSYQDVCEAEVIVMTRCRAQRNESEQAATVPFFLGIVAA